MKYLYRSFLILGLFTLFVADTVNAQNGGSLDTSFGTNGSVATHLNATATLNDTVVQTDRKIIVAGITFHPTAPTTFGMVARFNPNGALDTSFSGNGYNNETGIKDFQSVALQPDGKIVVAGGGSNNFDLARLNADGSLDTSFDSDGLVATPIGIYARAYSVNLLPDGKIIAVGETSLLNLSNRDFAVVKYNADGSLDTTFGTGGRVATELGSNDFAYDSVVQADGKIIAVGEYTEPLSNQKMLALVRYNADGTLDISFGTGGKVFRAGTGNARANEVILQADGKIIVTGNGTPAVRFNSNGTFDTEFGSVPWGSTLSAALQTDGKILIGGITTANVYLFARYNTNGTVDTTFGTNGRVGTPEVARKIVFTPDRRIVTGATRLNNNFEILLTRYRSSQITGFTPMDFDGDSKSDVAVFRPSTSGWYISRSSDDSFYGTTFGLSNDKLAPADFDGDGITDVSIFRNGTWLRINSTNSTFQTATLGSPVDTPAPADYDGDGKADLAIYRPSNGNWLRINSSNLLLLNISFGTAEDKPAIGDFDGDNKADISVFRPSTGSWYRLNSSDGSFTAVNFGIATDFPVPADYDGDGKTDIAVYRDGNWYRLNSSNGSFAGAVFGISTDKPVPADYDGDGKADLGVFRPSDGTWYLFKSITGFSAQPFGTNGDVPLPNAYIR